MDSLHSGKVQKYLFLGPCSADFDNQALRPRRDPLESHDLMLPTLLALLQELPEFSESALLGVCGREACGTWSDSVSFGRSTRSSAVLGDETL